MGRNYSRKDTPASADLPLIWDTANSDWRLTPFSAVATLMETLLPTVVPKPTTQYLTAPDAFSLTLEGTADIRAILTPAATLATGTVVLPISPGTVDKQEVFVHTTQEITALTITGNGATVVGGPTTLLAGGYFGLVYDMQTNSWYREA